MKAERLSKYLSLVLRHRPEVGRIVLDEEGWADLNTLVANIIGGGVSRSDVERVVRENDKQRFTIQGDRIRANQGHTVPIDLKLEPVEPPEFLYHGTNPQAIPSIQNQGLLRMKRHHVHMSDAYGTAVTVGCRTGSPVVYRISARQMHQDGCLFYRSVNGVWLAEHVPAQYLQIMDRKTR